MNQISRWWLDVKYKRINDDSGGCGKLGGVGVEERGGSGSFEPPPSELEMTNSELKV